MRGTTLEEQPSSVMTELANSTRSDALMRTNRTKNAPLLINGSSNACIYGDGRHEEYIWRLIVSWLNSLSLSDDTPNPKPRSSSPTTGNTSI